MKSVLDRFGAVGIWFRAKGEKVLAYGRLDDEMKALLAANREAIRAEVQAIEERRRRLLALLAERPGQRYVLLHDPDASPEYDVLAMAIPGATFEVRVPKPADSIEFAERVLGLLERHR